MNKDPLPDEAPQPDGEDKRKPQVYTDEAKDAQTSHWDMDYMTSEQLREAFGEGAKKPPLESSKKPPEQ